MANEKQIRKQSWSEILGTMRDYFSDDAFYAAVGSYAAGGSIGRVHPANNELGRHRHIRRSREAAPNNGAQERVLLKGTSKDVSGGADIENHVRKNAVELRASMRGSYPNDSVDIRTKPRSYSVSSHRLGSVNRRKLDVITSRNSLQLGASKPDMSSQDVKTKLTRSVSARPCNGGDGQRYPNLDFSSDSRSSSEKPPKPASGKCDKCDGPHATDSCPHFRRPREKHKDAWANYGSRRSQQLGATRENFILRGGRCVSQPGDGNCLFHSLCFGLNGGKTGRLSASELRNQLATFIARNPNLEIAGDTLEEWVQWDSNSSASRYAARMARGGWGGGIEMAACSLMKHVNVHVYERGYGGFKRISCFDCPEPATKTIHVLYQGGVHYDALLPSA